MSTWIGLPAAAESLLTVEPFATEVYLSVLLTRFAFELTDQTITWNSSSINYPTMGEESTSPEMLLKVRML